MDRPEKRRWLQTEAVVTRTPLSDGQLTSKLKRPVPVESVLGRSSTVSYEEHAGNYVTGRISRTFQCGRYRSHTVSSITLRYHCGRRKCKKEKVLLLTTQMITALAILRRSDMSSTRAMMSFQKLATTHVNVHICGTCGCSYMWCNQSYPAPNTNALVAYHLLLRESVLRSEHNLVDEADHWQQSANNHRITHVLSNRATKRKTMLYGCARCTEIPLRSHIISCKKTLSVLWSKTAIVESRLNAYRCSVDVALMEYS